jgi:hypothetical protein
VGTTSEKYEISCYIESTWICAENGPIYAPTVWNHCFDLNRTNNATEGFHSKLNRYVNKSVVGFYEVANCLKEILLDNSIELLRLLNGGRTKNRKKNHIE